MRASASEEDGVIGYQARTVTPAIMQPIAAAALPSMMILPAVAFMRSSRKGSVFVRFFCGPVEAAADRLHVDLDRLLPCP